jgi:hypothetical protein
MMPVDNNQLEHPEGPPPEESQSLDMERLLKAIDNITPVIGLSATVFAAITVSAPTMIVAAAIVAAAAILKLRNRQSTLQQVADEDAPSETEADQTKKSEDNTPPT